MKHLKILGLLVMAAASLMAFASSASAAGVLTSPAGTEYTSTIHATLEPETSALLKAGIEDTCTESTAFGTVTRNDTTGANPEASGPLSALTFGKCTKHTIVESAGSLTINDAGKVFTKESRVTVKDTVFGITCWYGAEATPVEIGTLTGGTTATMDISTTHLKRLPPSDEFFCAAEGTWTGKYQVTSPDTLLVT